jgi:hypothetical protein
MAYYDWIVIARILLVLHKLDVIQRGEVSKTLEEIEIR